MYECEESRTIPMKITSIHHSANLGSDGLGKIELKRLPRIVIIAGPNGSGKTRLLKRIKAMNGCDQNPNTVQRSKVEQTAKNYLSKFGRYRSSIDQSIGWQNGKKYSLSSLDAHADNPNIKFQVASFTTSSSPPIDPSSQNPTQLKKATENAMKPGLEGVLAGTFSYLTKIQNRSREASHQYCQLPPKDAEEHVQNFVDLHLLVKRLLGSDLGRNADGEVSLYGTPLAKANLSNGQLVLLQFAVALHAQKASLKDSILVFDEPENHLHAESLIETLTRIAEMNTEGQIWIATHSVPLIAGMTAKFDGDAALYCMEGGVISYAGRRPERVLNSLLGGEENREALRRFIDLPTRHAFQTFSSQCLAPPEVISGASAGDPQVEVIQRALHGRIKEDESLRVLDFGSGKGRLLDALAEEGSQSVSEWLDYIAYDPCTGDADLCVKAIERSYGEGSNRSFSNRSDLLDAVDKGSIDVAILCNVLHEISPLDWPSEFSDTSILQSVLKPEGYLLIVEDYLMPIGESAHDFGFVVLEKEPLLAFFGIKASAIESACSDKPGYERRIQAHLIPATALENVTRKTCLEALKISCRLSKDTLANLRARAKTGGTGYKDGLAMAFHTQQFANATLALNEFEN